MKMPGDAARKVRENKKGKEWPKETSKVGLSRHTFTGTGAGVGVVGIDVVVMNVDFAANLSLS